jgi:hypothetical protein
MAKFLLHLFQEGGCDYTIGCGHSLERFEAFSGDEIGDNIRRIVTDYGRDEISSVTLYEINDNNSQIDIDKLFTDADNAKAERERKQKELEERKLLEELRNKYPDA